MPWASPRRAAGGWTRGTCARRAAQLTSRVADTHAFHQAVLTMFARVLQLPGWARPAGSAPLLAERVRCKRISGAYTNAVFFVGYDAAGDGEGAVAPAPPTLLLRVYGTGSEALLSRRTELLILHTLSSLYEIGPHILGTFANGRVEEFYECESIGRAGLRDLGVEGSGREGTAQWVARRMRELHEVPLDVIRTVLEQGDLKAPSEKGFGRGIENHMMAASHHRPRRRSKAPPGATPAGLDSGSLTSPRWPGYSYFAHPSPALMRHANASTMSFDSLATSYDSHASSSESSGFLSRATSSLPYTPNYTPADAGAPRLTDAGPTMSPLALGPASMPSPHRGPYPGVWRRLKRWLREASKVLEHFNAFCTSPDGRVVCSALHLPPALPVVVEERGPPAARADELNNTRYSFADMFRCLLAIDLPRLCLEIAQFKAYVRRWERTHGKSRRVFCHNDSQYGNLLLLRLDEHGQLPAMASGMPRDGGASPRVGDSPGGARRSRSRSRARQPHQRLVVIDFEYASPNPRAYDIANHFHEWRANYHDAAKPWSLTAHGAFPTQSERRRWLRAYVEQGLVVSLRGAAAKPFVPDALPPVAELELPPAMTSPQGAPGTSPSSPLAALPHSEAAVSAEIDRLEEEVHVWSPATHAVWGLWGFVLALESIDVLIAQMRTQIERPPGEPARLRKASLLDEAPALEAGNADDFDNLRYSLGRIELFRQELAERGVVV